MASSTALLAIGMTLTGSGVVRDDLPHSVSGTCLALTALTAIALCFIRTWTRDTSQERADLASARRDAGAQERKYFALQAAIENEAVRMRRDINSERHAIAMAQAKERKDMEAEFEQRRLELTQKAFLEGVRMERAGHLRPDQRIAELIKFPG